jgi:hypothetical protein
MNSYDREREAREEEARKEAARISAAWAEANRLAARVAYSPKKF